MEKQVKEAMHRPVVSVSQAVQETWARKAQPDRQVHKAGLVSSAVGQRIGISRSVMLGRTFRLTK
jgi:hypothetical protein